MNWSSIFITGALLWGFCQLRRLHVFFFLLIYCLLMEAVLLHLNFSTTENKNSKRASAAVSSHGSRNRTNEASFSGQDSVIGMKHAFFSRRSLQMRRDQWKLAFALDTSGISSNREDADGVESDNSGLGGTRLGRIASAGGKVLLEKLNSARKNFPMKIFLLLLGFYTANALATILGQTGDWDVLVAGVVVAAIEGIGMLMYKMRPSPSSNGRLKSFVVMINYWKAGVCLGLFVDALKLGS